MKGSQDHWAGDGASGKEGNHGVDKLRIVAGE